MRERFQVHAIRAAKSPSDSSVTTHLIWVNMRALPANIPTDVNPRTPNMGTPTARKLLDAVSDPDTSFEIRNSGIVIVAKNVKSNPANGTVDIDFGGDPSRYGILDGGHTYKAILERRDSIPADIDKFVKLEVLVGEDLDVAALSDARNTTVQVSDIALSNLGERFEFIKNAIADQSYSGNIAYKDNDNEKPTPVSELLKLMYAFNIDRFADASMVPVAAYSGKTTVFRDFQREWDEHHANVNKNGKEVEAPSESNVYLQLAPMLPDFVKLYERIQEDMPRRLEQYRKEHRKKAVALPDTGKRGGNAKTLFTRQPIDYDVPAGYIMPIFGAFRALLERKSATGIVWVSDPLEMWDHIGADLVRNTLDTADNPRAAGKMKTLWQANYRIVEGEKTRRLLEKLAETVSCR